MCVEAEEIRCALRAIGARDFRGQNPKMPDTSAIMSPVAHSLNKSQIEAVAAYVSTLK
jgi:cytochrome c553